jgi:carbonic anhydrase/acetyltransferase-like protein (isoleucine patch superfamily)
MTSMPSTDGIRPNPVGDWPQIDPTAFVDPSAQIMGNVHIGARVYVGPQTVIRADEISEDGKVQPVIIDPDAYIQDGVIIHARAGSIVHIGSSSNIAHGVIIHGPCEIGARVFIALRTAIYNSTLEEDVWVGIGAIIMRATVPCMTMIPAGAMIRSESDIHGFRLSNHGEQQYKDGVIAASAALRDGYLALYKDGPPRREED